MSGILLLSLAVAPKAAAQTVFTNVPIANLPQAAVSSVAWGDYNNDGRLDFLITGIDSHYQPYSQLWQNMGSGFSNVTDVAAPGLPQVFVGSVAWADYDNDGRLDFLLTGDTQSIKVSQLWHNTGGGFAYVPIPNLPGVAGDYTVSSAAWGDYNNDGRLDFLITGTETGGGKISQLWQNTGSGFSNVTTSVAAGLPQVTDSSVAWGDYDNDGRLDFLITGSSGDGNVSQLWRNTGSGFTNVPIADLPQVADSSVAWGDFDNDGRLDFLITGVSSSGSTNVFQLWRNTGGGFTNVPIADLPQVADSSVAWGDYDNDGRLDFLITGTTNSDPSGAVSQLWRNTGSGFTNVPVTGLPQVAYGSVAWGDFDNDGRLDFLIAGAIDASFNLVSQLWRNTTAVTNTPPGMPTGLTMTATTNAVMLSWNSATDAQTPASGLSYNVRAGTTPGGIDLFAGHVNATNGFRRVPAMGNACLRHSLPLTGLTNGETVYWSVQAVDSAFAGGPFATETSVVTIPTLFVTTNSQPSTINISWTPLTWGWMLQETPSLAPAAWINSSSGELNPVTVSSTNPAMIYRLKNQ